MKRVRVLVLALLLLVSLAGCGKSPAKEVDVAALASKLAQEVQFESSLKELTAEQLGNYLPLPDGASAAAYMSNGTTAEEIIAVKCADEAAAKTLKTAVESFLADQRAEMERYQPEEVARMEKAVLAQRGSWVVRCVTDDTATAEKIIKEYLG